MNHDQLINNLNGMMVRCGTATSEVEIEVLDKEVEYLHALNTVAIDHMKRLLIIIFTQPHKDVTREIIDSKVKDHLAAGGNLKETGFGLWVCEIQDRLIDRNRSCDGLIDMLRYVIDVSQKMRDKKRMRWVDVKNCIGWIESAHHLLEIYEEENHENSVT